ncbi:MAG: acyl-CoA dehydratase activase [Dehalococcoidia bacterium]
MIVAGIDMGALTTKAVVLKDGEVIGQSIITASEEGEVQARRTLEEAIKQSGITPNDIQYIVVTGEGRKSVSFANKEKTTPTAISKGANKLFPSARMVIDVGGESSTVIRMTEKGGVEDSMSNDKCASGTGVFLETMAKLMQISLEEFARLSLQAQKKAEISNTCAIFAESEVVSHVHRDPPTPKNDVIAGIHASIASRIGGFVRRLGIKEDVVLSGGVAKNAGFARVMEEELGVRILIPQEPQLVAALGAARIAQEEMARKKTS